MTEGRTGGLPPWLQAPFVEYIAKHRELDTVLHLAIQGISRLPASLETPHVIADALGVEVDALGGREHGSGHVLDQVRALLVDQPEAVVLGDVSVDDAVVGGDGEPDAGADESAGLVRA